MKIILALILMINLLITSTANASNLVGEGKKILYIPIDDRPVNLKQSVEVIEKLGYEVLTPPENLLGNEKNYGEPIELWQWLNDNARGKTAAVISIDSMIYGSLVGSRKHELTTEEIMQRVKKFEEFQKNFPRLPIYVFSTIMRTPRSGAYSSAEPEYYQQFGGMIFNYTVLKDKLESDKLTPRERRQKKKLEKNIPAEVLEDWMKRRAKNFDANKYLIDLANQGVFRYFLLGCDDSAIFSQTHLESRHLDKHGKMLGKTRFLVTSGADELGMLMLSRAVNDDLNYYPFITVKYNDGKGSETIPSYGNEAIGDSIDGAITAIGAIKINDPSKADLVLAVNTNLDGKTFEAMSPKNIFKPRKSTKRFMKIINELLEKDYPLGIADISFANGADNALMYQLLKNDQQFKIKAYGGWNTATNSSGFLIGAGSLTRWLDDKSKNDLLMTRYFDDWAYQSNVRSMVANQLAKISGKGEYMKLDEKKIGAEDFGTYSIKNFADQYIKLPTNYFLEDIRMQFTWNRLFESDISFELK